MPSAEHRVVVRCASPRAAIWEAIGNSPLQNMAVGHAPLVATPLDEKDSASPYLLTTTLSGFSVRYREEPWQWDKGKYYTLRRDLESGAAKVISMRYALEDADDGGCVCTVDLTVVPRFAFLFPVVWVVSKLEIGRVGAYVREFDEAFRRGKQLQPKQSSADASRIAAAQRALEARHDRALVAELVTLVRDGADYEVARMRPYELARRWDAKRTDVLRLCLDAVGAGLLDLAWSLLCPSCATESQRLPSLRDLGDKGHCQVCDLQFGIDLSRAVEATFTPHVAVRPVEMRPFCVAGPVLTPHVLAQRVVRPGEPADMEAPGDVGRYRLFARGGSTAVVDVEAGAAAAVDVALAASGEARFSPAQIVIAPKGKLHVEAAKGAPPGQVKLERTAFTHDAATALEVSALPEFRAQFGGEALRPGLTLRVARVAVFFSDLCGSTALYSKVGDAAAFGVVSDCLTYGRAIVERHGGVVVKTMGDAVMGVFFDDASARAAAAETLHGWARFQEEHELARDLDIKVGLASGPCTIVTANGALDYFGQTVNTAARVQHLAGARELVVPVALAVDLPAGLVEKERFDRAVKGIPEPLALVRYGLGDGEGLARDEPIAEA